MPAAEPLVTDYRVGIVVSKDGPNGAQLAAIGAKLDATAKLLPEWGRIEVLVAGFRMDDPEGSVPRDLRNLLERKGKVARRYFGTRADRKAGVAQHILSEVRSCDEVWCCPDRNQTGRSEGRVAQVWRLGQSSDHHARYKTIPPWVEVPSVSKPAQPKKGKQACQKANKPSYRW